MGCESLIEIPSSISHLHKLEMLATVGCINLEVIPAHMNLESLQTVYLGGCSRLRNIPVMSTNIRYLFITNTAVEGVPLCPGLKTLDVSGSRNFKGLLTHLPTSLTTLNLCYTDIERIPDCFKSLHQLKGVNLRGCRRLASLPELPRSLLTLVADDCESLETVFCPLNTLKASFSFANCFKLDREARRAIIQQSFFMGKAVLPGREVPAVFDHRAKGYSLTIRPDGNPYTSFVFCVVVSRNQKSDKTIPPSLLWRRIIAQDEGYPVEVWNRIGDVFKYRTEHLLIFHFDFLEFDNRDIVFEFSSESHDFDIIECGAKVLAEKSIKESYESGSDQAFEDDVVFEPSKAFGDEKYGDCCIL